MYVCIILTKTKVADLIFLLITQKLGQPLFLMHASIRRGILSIKFNKVLLGIWFHSSCKARSNSFTFFAAV
ncbi:unnamed protein product [Rhizophagus irregularis]|nr:unnamed protein product [Rhizophagus irregularis]CAB4486029.1 unnamed protein product [Rhizophagus irregularis]